MAPEVIKGEQLSEGWIKSDVWSLGCTLVELISGGLPFAEFDNPMTAMYQIASGRAPVLPATSSAEAHSFVATCCAFDPAARPPISELLNHPFITKFVDSSLDSISIGALFNRLAIRSTDFKDIVTEIHADNIEASTGSELNNSAKELVITAVTANEPSFAVSFAEGQLLDGSRDCIFSTHRNDEVSDGSSKNEETMKFPPASLTIKLEPSFRSGMATSASNEELLRNLDTPKVMSLGIFSSRNNSSLDADIAIPNLTDGSNLVEYDLQSTESVFPPEPSQEEELRKADYSIANESEVTKELSDFETFYAVSQARNSSQISSTAPNFFDPSTADKESSDYDARNRSLQVSGVSMPLEPSRMSPRTVKVSPRAKARGAQLNEDSHSAKPSINNRSSPASIDMKPLLTKTKISGSSNFAFDDSISANMVDNAVSNANLKKKIQTEAAATTRLDPVAPVLLMLPQIKDRDRRMNGVKAEKVILFSTLWLICNSDGVYHFDYTTATNIWAESHIYEFPWRHKCFRLAAYCASIERPVRNDGSRCP
jgi:serine/threonine protein kinase